MFFACFFHPSCYREPAMITRPLLSIRLVSTVLLSPVEWVRSQTPAKPSIGPTLSVTDAGHWRTLQKGVALRTIALERAEPSYTLELRLVRFDGHIIIPRV